MAMMAVRPSDTTHAAMIAASSKSMGLLAALRIEMAKNNLGHGPLLHVYRAGVEPKARGSRTEPRIKAWQGPICLILSTRTDALVEVSRHS